LGFGQPCKKARGLIISFAIINEHPFALTIRAYLYSIAATHNGQINNFELDVCTLFGSVRVLSVRTYWNLDFTYHLKQLLQTSQTRTIGTLFYVDGFQKVE
jgi:predicted glutamine amidotransferase